MMPLVDKQPSKPPWITLLVCAVLGIALFNAIMIGTHGAVALGITFIFCSVIVTIAKRARGAEYRYLLWTLLVLLLSSLIYIGSFWR